MRVRVNVSERREGEREKESESQREKEREDARAPRHARASGRRKLCVAALKRIGPPHARRNEPTSGA